MFYAFLTCELFQWCVFLNLRLHGHLQLILISQCPYNYITALPCSLLPRDLRGPIALAQDDEHNERGEHERLGYVLDLMSKLIASLKLPPPAPLVVSTWVPFRETCPCPGEFWTGCLGESSSLSTPSGVIGPTLSLRSSSANVPLSLPAPSSSPQPFTSSHAPNTQKELLTSTRLGAGAFWVSTTRSSLMGMGGAL